MLTTLLLHRPTVIKVAGTSHHLDALSKMRTGDRVNLTPEPGNIYDSHAVAITTCRGEKLGYLPAAIAVRLSFVSPMSGTVQVLFLEGSPRGLRLQVTHVLSMAA
jgi:hypothetical protein